MNGNQVMIAENIAAVRQKIAAANILGQTVTLIAVTKNHEADAVREALAAGTSDIGENRVQEAKSKFAELAADGNADFAAARRHLIGHLQTNKAKDAVKIFDLIHSIDSVHLLDAVDKAAAKIDKRQDILIQINLAREETKTGALEEELPELLAAAKNATNLRLCGLMLIAPNYENVEDCRPLFAKMRNIFLGIQKSGDFGAAFRELSMGMSGDYQIAVNEGATMVRVGTAIFGARNYGGR